MQSFYWLLDFSYRYNITLKGNVHKEGAVALESEEREPRGTECVLAKSHHAVNVLVKAKFPKPPADETSQLWFFSVQELWTSKFKSKMI